MGGLGASWPWLMVSGASMGCSCQGFRLVSACRGMVLGTAPSGFLDRVPCQRLRAHWGHSAGLCLGLAFCGGCNWCIWRPVGRQMHQQCFSLRHQRPLRQSAEEAPRLHGFVPPWLERFLEHQKPCVLVHFHESPSRLHRFVERCHHLHADSH